MTTINLPYWMDGHAHFRQGPLADRMVEEHVKMGCDGFVAMPNLSPPITRVKKDPAHPGTSIEEYALQLINAMKAVPGYREGALKEALHSKNVSVARIVVPLYLCGETTPEMIKEGAKSGLLRSAKYYPPHGTTNSGGAIPLRELMTNGVLSAMQDNDIILNIHGEKHGTYRSDYFGPKGNAETAFYEDEFQLLRNLFPGLRMVAEHISTETALWAVQACDHRQVKATITPQHLLFSIADMLQGFKYHMACMPVLKFEEDREALLRAVLEDDKHLFAGTDSAPHTKKALACGCAAGCFTGGTAVQLYAMAFERHGNTLEEGWLGDIFRRFLCERGPAIYGFVPSTRTFKLVREPMVVERIATTDGIITPLAVGMAGGDAERNTIPWSVKL